VSTENEKDKKAAPAKAAPAKEGGEAKKGGDSKKGKRGKDTATASTIKLAGPGETRVSPSVPPRLVKVYQEQVIPALMKQFQFANSMQVPRLKKIIVNCAVKEAIGNPKVIDNALNDIMTVTGQKPVICRAKKAIATFKVRKGNAVGVRVTLRRARMLEFLDRLMNIALPRVRDFKGVNPKSFDGRGNYSLGLREQIIFPEINYDTVDSVRGMTVTIETTAKTNEHARALLTELGMPFRK
jgi:large subunit ribosomal protein L5